MPFISKSKYLSGLQCKKLLWYQYNAKDRIPSVDASTQAIFDQGHEVGRLAQTLFPNGIEIDGDPKDFGALFAQTNSALRERRPVYEATFRFGEGFARLDILNPVADGAWDIVEVKSSTEVKDVHIRDLALQRYVTEGAGVPIRKCFLMRIDNQYVRRGAVDPAKLFVQEDVTREVRDELARVGPNLQEMSQVIRNAVSPEVPIGPQCSDPYECILQDLCWKFVPEDSPLSLYHFRKARAFELVNSGVLSLDRLSSDEGLDKKQEIQVRAVTDGKPFVNQREILTFVRKLEYPVYYLDFETLQTAIPLFDGIRPYQKVPFQFSLHVEDAPGVPPQHFAYLSEGRIDPRPEVLEQLAQLLGKKGSIVSYNAAFERSVLSDAAAAFPAYRPWWEETVRRMVDLLQPLRGFSYYHPQQHGSASMKAILPAMTGKGYEELAIADGEAASREYLRVTFGEASEADRQGVREQLLEYCGLDTEGMIAIVRELMKLANGGR